MLAALFIVSNSYASLTVKSCIKLQTERKNCYLLHITITDTDAVLGTVYVASGDVWVGKGIKKIKLKTIPNCSYYRKNKQIFITDPGSKKCFKEIFTDPENYAKYETSRNEILNGINTEMIKQQNKKINKDKKTVRLVWYNEYGFLYTNLVIAIQHKNLSIL